MSKWKISLKIITTVNWMKGNGKIIVFFNSMQYIIKMNGQKGKSL